MIFHFHLVFAKCEPATRTMEAWTAKQLASLGIDSVFSPYVLGMLQLDGCDPDDEEEKRQQVLELLMGWLDESHKVSRR